jgi:hypothetical protein
VSLQRNKLGGEITPKSGPMPPDGGSGHLVLSSIVIVLSFLDASTIRAQAKLEMGWLE